MENIESTQQANKSRGLLWWAGRALAGLVILVLTLAGAGMAYQGLSAARDRRNHPPPGRLVDVGGYQLHLNCTGEGRPTVVMEAGLGAWSSAWIMVQPEAAKTARVCSYDRAGYGWSDPGPEPRTSQQIVDELHTLLANAGLEGPYVLVAHSFGGLNVRLYASQYPDEVAGMVLVDALHEDLGPRLPPEFQDPLVTQRRMFRSLSLMSRLGIIRLGLSSQGADLLPDFVKQLPPEEQQLALVFFARPDVYDTAILENVSMETSRAQLRTAGSLGDTPLLVLSARQSLTPVYAPPGYPVDQYNQAWIELQAELAALSSNSNQIITDESDHIIPLNQPGLVIDAIYQVVEAARTDGVLAHVP